MRDRTVVWWLLAGWIGYAVLPWYAVDDGFWSFEWLQDGYPLDEGYAPAFLQVLYG
jgi:iron(III) transport system permease protein